MEGSAVVPAAARTLDLLEAFRQERRPLSLSELARIARVPISSCHGLVRTLEQKGFLYFPSLREVYPTRRLLDLARDIDANDPVAARLAPVLQSLRDATGETVILGMQHGAAVLYLLVVEGPQIVRYTARAGEYKPLHSSSIGKALLAAKSDQDLAAWLARNELPRITDRTITTARRLKRDIDEARSRGYTVTRGENVADVMAIAAPLQQGSTTFGVAVAGPLHRMQTAEARHATQLRETIRGIEEKTGG